MGIVISTHLPPPVMIERTAALKCVTHILCWSWAMYFSAAASSENDHGSMNLDSKTAPVASTVPSRVATIQGMAECLTRRWTSVTGRPVLRSYQIRLSSSVAAPSWTTRLLDRSSGSASPRFSRQSRSRAASSPPMMIRAADEAAAIIVTSSPQLRFQCLPPPVLKMAFADSSLYDLNNHYGMKNSIMDDKVNKAAKPLTSAQMRAARALIRWSAEDLARETALSVTTIRRAELTDYETSMTTANDLAVRRALEAAGVDFIDENGGGPGVRLRQRRRPKPPKR